MRDSGLNPKLLFVSSASAATLDLSENVGTAGGYLFPTRASGSADPLWGLRVVESAAWTHEPAPSTRSRWEASTWATWRSTRTAPATAKKNLVTLRAEVQGLFVVRNVAAIKFCEVVS